MHAAASGQLDLACQLPRYNQFVPPQAPSDTSAEVLAFQFEAYRRMDGAARVETAARMSDDLREVALAGIRGRHPEYSEEQARLALYRLLHGDDVFRGAWPGSELLDP